MPWTLLQDLHWKGLPSPSHSDYNFKSEHKVKDWKSKSTFYLNQQQLQEEIHMKPGHFIYLIQSRWRWSYIMHIHHKLPNVLKKSLIRHIDGILSSVIMNPKIIKSTASILKNVYHCCDYFNINVICTNFYKIIPVALPDLRLCRL